MNDTIIIKGAREHNLKNIDLSIPKNKLVVFTGISGSGKSSMAFDTIYAEGQRRYIESLSSYARQFLGGLHKPEVDFIEGLSPSISIDQKTKNSNPRSTVGTITEIYDYFRLLFAKIGHPYCPVCGTKISRLSIDEITDAIITNISETAQRSTKPSRFEILSPIVRDRKGEFTGLFDNVRSKGFSRVYVDSEEKSLSEDIPLIKTNSHTVHLVIDTLQLQFSQIKNTDFLTSFRSRLTTAVEQSLLLSNGLVHVKNNADGKESIYSQNFSCPRCGYTIPEIEPRLFSFNSPHGACSECKGLGLLNTVDPSLVLNKNLSISEGAIVVFTKLFFNDTWFSRLFSTFLKREGISETVVISKMDKREYKLLLYGTKKKYIVEGKNRFGRDTVIEETFSGVLGELEKKYVESSSDFVRMEIGKYMTEEECKKCYGKRLNTDALCVKLNSLSIYDYGELPVDKLINEIIKLELAFSDYEKKIATIILKEINVRLGFLLSVGLTYLSLNRAANSLSGGESQRIRLASQIGSGLSGVIYVLDEPSIGLHPKDVHALITSLKHLRDLGNTIIVVEHDKDTIQEADYIVDFGELAGKKGGKIVFQGLFSELKKANTITADYMFHKTINIQKPIVSLSNNGTISIFGCRQFNLKNIDVSFPIGKFSVVTGVSGSGKSTLLIDTLYRAMRYYVEGYQKDKIGTFERLTGYEHIDKLYLVDQSPIGKTPRSNPATYIGAFDEIRQLFSQSFDARIHGYSKSRFSFNIKGGRCEKCQGAGSIKIEMQFLPDVYIICDVCNGSRYNRETLEVKYKDQTIYDVLKMNIAEASRFFDSFPAITNKFSVVSDVGLSYLELGQPAPTLSGGEAQRIKLAGELSKNKNGRTLYILDEPTTGLHMFDIEKLLHTLYKLVELGHTVIVIEHNTEVITNAQYVVDLGLDGGEAGGSVLYQGELNGLKNIKKSYTAKYL